MLKNILTFLVLVFGLSAFAADNYLNSIVIENTDINEVIILRSDALAKIKKETENSDKIILTVKNIKQSPDINTLYRNISGASGLIVENDGNDLKIYIESPNISNAKVVFQTPNSAPITVSDTNEKSRFVWSVLSLLIMLFVIFNSSRNSSAEQDKKDINEIIKEREKALYKSFQKEVATLPSMNYKLKSYSKHVLKGETIRSYESRMSKL